MPKANFEQLVSALNLSSGPFIAQHGEHFFTGGGRQQLLEQLIHQCRYGPTLLILLGEQGVGKTSLIEHFSRRIDPAIYRVVSIGADILADPLFLLDELEQGFKLDLGDSEAEAIQALVRFATELDSFSQTPVVIVDDAQNLSVEAVASVQRMLRSLQGTGMHLVLVADADSLAKVPVLAGLQAAYIDYQEMHVPCLSTAALSEYINYRLVCSGLTGVRFSEAQLQQVYLESQGNLDRVNMAARQVLAQHQQIEQKRVSMQEQDQQAKSEKTTASNSRDYPLPILHISLALVVVVILFLLYWLYPQIDQSDQATSPEATENKGVAVSHQGSLDGEEPQVIISTPVDESFPSKPLEKSNRDQAVNDNVDFNYTEVSEADFDESFLRRETAAAKLPVERPKPKSVKRGSATATSADAKVAPVTAAASEKLEVKPAIKQALKSEPLSKPKITAPKARSFSAREQWLLSLGGGHYSLQLLGARNEAAVRQYIARYPALKEIAYYKTRHKGAAWYVVVYGDFSSREAARNRLASLPAELRQARPWVRRISDIQRDIRSTN